MWVVNKFLRIFLNISCSLSFTFVKLLEYVDWLNLFFWSIESVAKIDYTNKNISEKIHSQSLLQDCMNGIYVVLGVYKITSDHQDSVFYSTWNLFKLFPIWHKAKGFLSLFAFSIHNFYIVDIMILWGFHWNEKLEICIHKEIVQFTV